MRARTLRGNSSLDTLIAALCHDYRRRFDIIKNGSATARTLAEMEYLNYKIYNAAAEIAGDERAELYINEIGDARGYAKSEDYSVSEITYKMRKKEIKDGIAESLYLV